MPRFAYTARSAAGKTVEATLEAPSRKDAARLLAARGLQTVRLDELAGSATAPSASAAKKSAPTSFLDTEVVSSSRSARFTSELQLPFLQSLSDLIGSGMPAGESVRLLSQRLQEPRLRALCAALWEKLSEGLPLSHAMESVPGVFAGHTVNLIAAGEATGNLREVLARLIDHYTAQREMRRMIVTAMIYPLVVLGVAVLVILLFVFVLLPRLQSLLNSLGGNLPWTTRVMVGLSEFVVNYGVFVAGGATVAALAFWQWRRTSRGRATTDRWALRVPIIGSFLRTANVENFCATLAVLLESGITTAEALRIAERTIDNRVLRTAMMESTSRVLEGMSLSQSLERTGQMPPLVLDRLAVGESTGNLAPSLRGIAKTYQASLKHQSAMFIQVLTLGIMLFTFSFVGFVALAMVSAVFQVSASFKF